MDISLSRWLLVFPMVLFLVGYVIALPGKIQFHYRQRPFRRAENSHGYIEDSSTLTPGELYAFSLERMFTKNGKRFAAYKEALNRIQEGFSGVMCTSIALSLLLNALGY